MYGLYPGYTQISTFLATRYARNSATAETKS